MHWSVISVLSALLLGCQKTVQKESSSSMQSTREVRDIFKTIETVEAECKAAAGPAGSEACPPANGLKLQFGGSITLVAADSADGVADAYVSKDRRFSVKVAKEETVCHELAVLTGLAGLGSSTSRAFQVDPSGLPQGCKSRILVTEFPGDSGLKSLGLTAGNPLLYAAAARILEIVRDLHALRIVHNDIRVGSFVFSDAARPIETLKLIDFAIASPYVTSDGSRPADALGTVTSDLVSVAKMLRRLARPPVFEAFEQAAAVATATFDYDSWIARFAQASKQL